jgi:hypothetical protein
MIRALPRPRLSPRTVVIVLLAAATFLLLRSLAREHLLQQPCGATDFLDEGGRCRPAPPPVIIHRDILRT